MAKNDFKAFATDLNANVMSQEEWEALPALLSGFTAGKASSAQVNKVIRQASFIAAALAQYTANKSGLDVLDDGDLNGFISKMGTAFGKDFQALDATLTALAGLATGENKLPYFTGNDTAAQTDLTSVGRDIIGKSTIADILTYLQLRESFSGVVGQSRNARMSVAAASATATFSADELIVEDSGGHQYRVTSFSGTINIATTGINGMDTGSAPVNGYVAIYAIYNPTTQTTALLAVDNSTTVATEVYTGSHMPAGYTASALISVWPTSSSQLVVGNQLGRKVHIPGTVIVSTTCSVTSSVAVVGSFTTGLISPNARSIDGKCYILANAGQQAEVSLLSVPVPGTGSRFVVNAIATQAYGVTMQFEDNPVYQSQTSLIYAFSTSGATFNYSITMKGYTF
ncbi:hypothetical protein [Escherichia coli]|uniref:hypothetical protein n=1 Tax=Escherichia coli TaxID=562 RepID=UPI0039C88288